MAHDAHESDSAEGHDTGLTMLRLIFARWVSQAIGAAAELRIADHLSKGPKTAEELAVAVQAHGPSVYRLLRALAEVGVFAEDDKTRAFSNTSMSEVLRSDVPGSMLPFVLYSNHPIQLKSWMELPHAVRTGQSGFERAFGMTPNAYYGQNPEAARFFSATMSAFCSHDAEDVAALYDFSKVKTLVDVGGNKGTLLGTVLARHPHLHGVLLDLPSQVEGAPVELARLGVADRCKVVAGDFFRDVPGGGEAYMMRRVLHDWDDDDCVRIIKSVHGASPPGAKLLVLELPLGEGPDKAKFVDLEMLAYLGAGRERTLEHYEELMRRGGFGATRKIPSPSSTMLTILEGTRA